MEQRRTEQARREMIAAAKVLPPLTAPQGQDTVEIAFLSGEHFWWNPVLRRLAADPFSGAHLTMVHDDGTFNEVTWSAFSRVVPWARLVAGAEIETALKAHFRSAASLPCVAVGSAIPICASSPISTSAAAAGWRFCNSTCWSFVRQKRCWAGSLHRTVPVASEHISAYGYSPRLMRELAGAEPPARVNVGVCGLRSDAIDWDRPEYWCREMLECEGTHYFQEQALTAMLLTGQECHRFGPPDYVVMPSLAEGRRPAAALHHYVSSSKRSYFQHGWRRALADS